MTEIDPDFKRDPRDYITIVMPWHGRHPHYYDEAIASIPNGYKIIVALNNGKHEMADAMNEAILMADTPFIFLMPADDWLEPDTLDHLFAAIGTGDVAYPTVRFVGEDKDRHGPNGGFICDVFSIHRLQRWNYIVGPCLYRRSKILEIGGVRDIPVEDWDMHYRLAHAGARYVPCPEATFNYRLHHDSLSSDIVRIAAEIGGTDQDLVRASVASHGQHPLLATWYVNSNHALSEIRSVIPAKFLPGIARRTWDLENDYGTPCAIFQIPTAAELPFADSCRRELNQAVMVEVDDNYISPVFIPTIKSWGLTSLAEQWKGKNVKAHRRMCRWADGIICSTPMLAESYAELNDNVHVILNSVDPSMWSAPRRLDDGKIRVGWAAGTQHIPDGDLVYDALKWASEQDGVEVVLIGVRPDWYDFEHKWIPFTASSQVYRDVLSILDIGMAPLKGGVLNDAKSDIKYLDYTMAGALTIASKRPAYTLTVEHDKTGILCSTPAQFLKAVQEAVADTDRRYELLDNAQTYLYGNRLAHHMRGAYLSALYSVGVMEEVRDDGSGPAELVEAAEGTR